MVLNRAKKHFFVTTIEVKFWSVSLLILWVFFYLSLNMYFLNLVNSSNLTCMFDCKTMGFFFVWKYLYHWWAFRIKMAVTITRIKSMESLSGFGIPPHFKELFSINFDEYRQSMTSMEVRPNIESSYSFNYAVFILKINLERKWIETFFFPQECSFDNFLHWALHNPLQIHVKTFKLTWWWHAKCLGQNFINSSR